MSMKRIVFVLFLIISFGLPSAAYDGLDEFSGIDRAWDGQKSITNKEFEEAIDILEAKKKQCEAKQRKRQIKRIGGGGTSLHPGLHPDAEIKSMTSIDKKDEGLLLNVPVTMIIDDCPLEKGYYKVVAERDKNNDIYLSFYQSRFFKGKVRASETNDDFDEETIDFVKLIPYNDSFVRIIFGSLDFNAYAYVRYNKDVSAD